MKLYECIDDSLIYTLEEKILHFNGYTVGRKLPVPVRLVRLEKVLKGKKELDPTKIFPELEHNHQFVLRPYERAIVRTGITFNPPDPSDVSMVIPFSPLVKRRGLMVMEPFIFGHGEEIELTIYNSTQYLSSMNYGEMIAFLKPL